jgi:hypothetical protein
MFDDQASLTKKLTAEIAALRSELDDVTKHMAAERANHKKQIDITSYRVQ